MATMTSKLTVSKQPVPPVGIPWGNVPIGFFFIDNFNDLRLKISDTHIIYWSTRGESHLPMTAKLDDSKTVWPVKLVNNMEFVVYNYIEKVN